MTDEGDPLDRIAPVSAEDIGLVLEPVSAEDIGLELVPMDDDLPHR